MLKRTAVGAALLLVFAAALAFAGWVQCVLFSLAATLSVFEISRAYRGIPCNVFAVPSYAFAAFFFALYKLFGPAPVFVLWLMCVLCVAAERVLNGKRTTQEALVGLSVLIYPLSLYAVLMLLAVNGSFNQSRIALLCTFAMPLMGDIMAYFSGRLFGKKKLSPKLSPNKTVAGSIGGLFGGCLGGALAYAMQGVFPAGMGLVKLLALGLVCGAAGQIGDLFASAIKRYTGVKDYGAILPGHGGVSDRLDSVLFCAPIVYAVFTLSFL